MKLIFAIITAWFICQTIKFFIRWHQFNRTNIWVYLEEGGMPSSHSSILIALTTGLFYETGLSTIFITSAFITLVFLSRLMKIKPQPGIQSELMAKFIDIREILRRKFTESLGHTPEQVFVGAFIGFIVASFVYMF